MCKCERKRKKMHMKGESLIWAANAKQRKKSQTFQFYLSFLLRIISFDKTFNPKQNQFSQAVAFTGICVICIPKGKSKHPPRKTPQRLLRLGFVAQPVLPYPPVLCLWVCPQPYSLERELTSLHAAVLQVMSWLQRGSEKFLSHPEKYSYLLVNVWYWKV